MRDSALKVAHRPAHPVAQVEDVAALQRFPVCGPLAVAWSEETAHLLGG
jgi:hypothetical protein